MGSNVPVMDEAMDEMIYEMSDICHFVQLYHPFGLIWPFR